MTDDSDHTIWIREVQMDRLALQGLYVHMLALNGGSNLRQKMIGSGAM